MPATTFNPAKRSVKLAIRKKKSPVTAESAIHRRLLFINKNLPDEKKIFSPMNSNSERL
jgi:hypothetical protein